MLQNAADIQQYHAGVDGTTMHLSVSISERCLEIQFAVYKKILDQGLIRSGSRQAISTD